MSHEHLDHLDPATLRSLHDASPHSVVVAPLTVRDALLSLDWRPERVRSTRDGDAVHVDGVTITAFGVAHEQHDENAQLGHPYQGCHVTNGHMSIAHVGDCLVDDGLRDALRRLRPDVICLPVNGRDEKRAAMGSDGNMTAEEAAALIRETGIRRVVPMYNDMVAQNREPGAESRLRAALGETPGVRVETPRVGEAVAIGGGA